MDFSIDLSNQDYKEYARLFPASSFMHVNIDRVISQELTINRNVNTILLIFNFKASCTLFKSHHDYWDRRKYFLLGFMLHCAIQEQDRA